MIQIVKNKRPAVNDVRMICDRKLSRHLDSTPLLSLINNCANCLAVLGRPGSGKTTKVLSWLDSEGVFKGCYENMFFIFPESSQRSASQFFDKYADELEGNIYNECNAETLLEIEQRAKDDASTKDLDDNGRPAFYKSILVIDDAQQMFKQRDVSIVLDRLVQNRRHNHLSIILICQTFRKMPVSIRSSLTGVMLFKPSLTDFIKISSEFFTLDDATVKAIYKTVFEGNHQKGDFLFHHPDSARYFRNFDELILS